MKIGEFQELIAKIYLKKDSARGTAGTFQWFVEEVGELARAIRKGDTDSLREEFADCLAWLSSLASLAGIDLESAAERYSGGCPKCHELACSCEEGKVLSRGH
jgi:NTP pyrophosphatase (non-canonical NTP hydrolase)